MTPDDTRAVQRLLNALGPVFGAQWHPIAEDGRDGPQTRGRLYDALRAAQAHIPEETSRTVPAEWLPACKMDRIVFHWTAGRHTANAAERKAYHILIEGTGDLVRGPSIALNANPVKPGYAAHTLNLNGGSIGVALCGMIGAQERPFNPGPEPITQRQWDVLPRVLGDLCRFYKIPVTPETVLSHAEVQGTLGVKQKNKWDIARLPFDLGTVGADAIGDEMRAAI